MFGFDLGTHVIRCSKSRQTIRGAGLKTWIHDNRELVDFVPVNLAIELWLLSGFVYTAFVTDVYSRKIVGWATRSTMQTEELPLEALEQAIMNAKDIAGLVHHSDHGSQYASIKYGEKLADYGIKSSTGTVGDSYDNALAETGNGLYKTELIYSQAWLMYRG